MANMKEGDMLGSSVDPRIGEQTDAAHQARRVAEALAAQAQSSANQSRAYLGNQRREALQMAISAFGGTSKEIILDGAKAFASFLEKGE